MNLTYTRASLHICIYLYKYVVGICVIILHLDNVLFTNIFIIRIYNVSYDIFLFIFELRILNTSSFWVTNVRLWVEFANNGKDLTIDLCKKCPICCACLCSSIPGDVSSNGIWIFVKHHSCTEILHN